MFMVADGKGPLDEELIVILARGQIDMVVLKPPSCEFALIEC